MSDDTEAARLRVLLADEEAARTAYRQSGTDNDYLEWLYRRRLVEWHAANALPGLLAERAALLRG